MGEQISPEFIFLSGISKILFDLGSWDNFGRLRSRIRKGFSHMCLKTENRNVIGCNEKESYKENRKE